MAIQSKTARRLMYEWHSGQWSELYAVASSGLVSSYDQLLREVSSISSDKDMLRLTEWLERHLYSGHDVVIDGRVFVALPWSDYYNK